MHLHIVDYAIIVIYFVFVLGIGFALAAAVLLTGLLAYWFVVGKLVSRHLSS